MSSQTLSGMAMAILASALLASPSVAALASPAAVFATMTPRSDQLEYAGAFGNNWFTDCWSSFIAGTEFDGTISKGRVKETKGTKIFGTTMGLLLCV